jgi:hypothetical protein
MKKEYEITLAKFNSDCRQYYEVTEDIAIEDVHFMKFTELLDSASVIKNPNFCRYEGLGLKNSKWSLLGYSSTNDLVSEDDDNTEEETNSVKEYEWNFCFYNGFFSGDNTIINSKKTDIQKAVTETVKFIEATFSGNSKFLVQDYHPVRELQDFIIGLNNKKLLDKIEIFIVTDNLIEHENLEQSVFIEALQISCKIQYWGLNKWSDLSRSKSKKMPIDIDFVNDSKFKFDVSFLERKNNEDVKYYLTIFPGDLIADLYKEYDTQLLEKNVRVFLSLKSKYNRQMSKTISDNPDMFFSYNNGLSATASSIKVNRDSGKIESISDFQIVNGGQTTATLYHTKKHLKKSLSDIFVQVKISVLRKSDNYPLLISNISRFANSQTAVKPSDFWTNDVFLIDFEKIALRNPVQIEGSYIYYFFERMAGQYKETKARKGTPRDQAAWEKQNPKKFAFNKIDLARWFNAMALEPHISVSSAEKQFDTFMKKEGKPNLSVARYKSVIGFGQLCIRARKVCGKGANSIIGDPDVGMATSIYAMAYLHYITDGKFDYHKIYDQKIDIEKLDSLLASIIKKCWDKIYQFDKLHPRDKTKVEACWKFVKREVRLSESNLNSLAKFLISNKEYKLRESGDLSEEEYYFTNLKQFLKNKGGLLYAMADIATTDNSYYKYKTLLKNIIERINSKNGIITLAKIKELVVFKDELSDYDLTGSGKFSKTINIDLAHLNDTVFRSRNTFFENIERIVSSKKGEDFENHMLLLDEIKKLVESFDLYPGLSLKDMERIEEILNIFDM